MKLAVYGFLWPHHCLPAAPPSLLPISPEPCYCALSQSTNANVVPFSPHVPQLPFPLTDSLTGSLVLRSGFCLSLLVSPTSLLLARWLIPFFLPLSPSLTHSPSLFHNFPSHSKLFGGKKSHHKNSTAPAKELTTLHHTLKAWQCKG